ncbi:MAG: tetraacyldisaccharide 4'-kinase [Bacteroidia bacterium]|nr:tetraacyldisaccharide 4'-kinase [Bacteroidia bacterium]MCO5253431.1 tetraacyldisaccharide 4'-kinase [Bacteroidota bacterium]
MGLRFLLLPLAWLFGVIAKLRWCLFDKGLLKRTKAPIPSVVVGNIRVGGTGKSPIVMLLAEQLLAKGIKPAILSRGYGRKSKGFLEVQPTMNASQGGDETLMIKRRFSNLNVFVCENRVQGIRKIKELYPHTSLVLLDDAFQHFRLKSDFYILLTEWAKPFYHDFPMPAGMLREFRSSAERADTVITTKTPKHTSVSSQSTHLSRIGNYTQAPHFFASILYQEPVNIGNKLSKDWESIANKGVILVTGISNPEPILDYLHEKKISVIHHKFNDHEPISQNRIDAISAQAKESGRIVLCTEKDAARVQVSSETELWYYLPIKIEIENVDDLLKLIENNLNFSHHK